MGTPPRGASHRAALLILASFALALTTCVAAAAQAAGQPAAQQTQTPAVARPPASADGESRLLTVTVTDERGRHLLKLPRQAFKVYADKQPLAVTHFGELDIPATVGFVLDASGSMKDVYRRAGGGGMSLAERVVARFLELGHGSNEYFVIGFNEAPRLLRDRTTDRGAVLAAVGEMSKFAPRGPTALYDAVYLAVHKAAGGSRMKRVVVVISDGQDNRSTYNLRELKDLLREQDVLVYTIALYDLADEASVLDQAGRAIMEELAEGTGGRMFSAHLRNLGAAVDAVGAELRRQYIVGVKLPPAGDKRRWHDLDVKMEAVRDEATGKTLKARARTRGGFFDSPAPPR